MSKNHTEKHTFSALVASKLRLPGDLLPDEFRVEMRGTRLLYIYGCRRILKYSRDEMIVAAKAFAVTVSGTDLTCSFFYGGTVAIEGIINGFYILDKDWGASEK